MKSYYETQAAIRYYGSLPDDVERDSQYVTGRMAFEVKDSDTVGSQPFPARSDSPFDMSRWREPPHVALANLSLENAALGPVYQFTKRYGYLIGHVDVASGYFYVDVAKIAAMQKLIREAWTGERTAIEKLKNALSAEVSLSIEIKEIEIGISDLWSLIRLLFLRGYATKKTRVCANPDCPAPYFLESRRGQKFCSHACAVLINVRRFRERDAKRRAEHSKKKVEGRKRHGTFQAR